MDPTGTRESIDRRTRKMMYLYGAIHPRADEDRPMYEEMKVVEG